MSSSARKHRAAPPAPPTPPPLLAPPPAAAGKLLTPGGYMRACRLRAGVTIAAAASAVSIRPADRTTAAFDLARLEANERGDYGRLVTALRDHRAFPFDFATFVALAAETACPDGDFDPGQDGGS